MEKSHDTESRLRWPTNAIAPIEIAGFRPAFEPMQEVESFEDDEQPVGFRWKRIDVATSVV